MYTIDELFLMQLSAGMGCAGNISGQQVNDGCVLWIYDYVLLKALNFQPAGMIRLKS